MYGISLHNGECCFKKKKQQSNLSISLMKMKSSFLKYLDIKIWPSPVWTLGGVSSNVSWGELGKNKKKSDLLGVSRGEKKIKKIRSEFSAHVYLIIIRAVTGIITAVYLLLC